MSDYEPKFNKKLIVTQTALIFYKLIYTQNQWDLEKLIKSSQKRAEHIPQKIVVFIDL